VVEVVVVVVVVDKRFLVCIRHQRVRKSMQMHSKSSVDTLMSHCYYTEQGRAYPCFHVPCCAPAVIRLHRTTIATTAAAAAAATAAAATTNDVPVATTTAAVAVAAAVALACSCSCCFCLCCFFQRKKISEISFVFFALLFRHH
jgi:hypothetical protein